MIYHIDDIMKEVILERLEVQNIKVNLTKSFVYNGYRINLVERTSECLRPIKCKLEGGTQNVSELCRFN